MSHRRTTGEFIVDAIKVHGELYDYSKSWYVNNNTKIEIICKVHGSFWQVPNSHISNECGCPWCGKTKKLTIELFVEKAKKIHGCVYDYYKSVYKNSHSFITIMCRLHGDFKQRAYSHLNGLGCGKCGGTIKSNIEEFVKKSTYIHEDRYDYSKSEYENNHKKLVIICPIHNEFLQTPNDHLNGKGCPMCIHRISKPEKEFLDYCKVDLNNRQKRILLFNVDGIDEKTNTIYEFLGDYWHGNLKNHISEQLHPKRKITFGELNKKTFDRFDILKKNGYNIKYIWESDWKKFKNGAINVPEIKEHQNI